jgi:hypothetical protein
MLAPPRVEINQDNTHGRRMVESMTIEEFKMPPKALRGAREPEE